MSCPRSQSKHTNLHSNMQSRSRSGGDSAARSPAGPPRNFRLHITTSILLCKWPYSHSVAPSHAMGGATSRVMTGTRQANSSIERSESDLLADLERDLASVSSDAICPVDPLVELRSLLSIGFEHKEHGLFDREWDQYRELVQSGMQSASQLEDDLVEATSEMREEALRIVSPVAVEPWRTALSNSAASIVASNSDSPTYKAYDGYDERAALGKFSVTPFPVSHSSLYDVDAVSGDAVEHSGASTYLISDVRDPSQPAQFENLPADYVSSMLTDYRLILLDVEAEAKLALPPTAAAYTTRVAPAASDGPTDGPLLHTSEHAYDHIETSALGQVESAPAAVARDDDEEEEEERLERDALVLIEAANREQERRRQLSIAQEQTRRHLVLCDAATRFQAAARGRLVRKRVRLRERLEQRRRLREHQLAITRALSTGGVAACGTFLTSVPDALCDDAQQSAPLSPDDQADLTAAIASAQLIRARYERESEERRLMAQADAESRAFHNALAAFAAEADRLSTERIRMAAAEEESAAVNAAWRQHEHEAALKLERQRRLQVLERLAMYTADSRSMQAQRAMESQARLDQFFFFPYARGLQRRSLMPVLQAASAVAVSLQSIWRGRAVRLAPENAWRMRCETNAALLRSRVARAQALWRGYRLRKRLREATEWARYDDGDGFDYAPLDVASFLGVPPPSSSAAQPRPPTVGHSSMALDDTSGTHGPAILQHVTVDLGDISLSSGPDGEIPPQAGRDASVRQHQADTADAASLQQADFLRDFADALSRLPPWLTNGPGEDSTADNAADASDPPLAEVSAADAAPPVRTGTADSSGSHVSSQTCLSDASAAADGKGADGRGGELDDGWAFVDEATRRLAALRAQRMGGGGRGGGHSAARYRAGAVLAGSAAGAGVIASRAGSSSPFTTVAPLGPLAAMELPRSDREVFHARPRGGRGGRRRLAAW